MKEVIILALLIVLLSVNRQDFGRNSVPILITSNAPKLRGDYISDVQSGEAEPHLSYSNVTEKQLKKN